MRMFIKLTITVFTTFLSFQCISTVPVNSIQTKTIEANKPASVSNHSSPIENTKLNSSSNCISLWDVDASVIRNAMKDKELTLFKQKSNNRHKRFALPDNSTKIANVSTRKDKTIKIINKDKREQKRSFMDPVNLICTKTETGFQCHSNNSDVAFKTADIPEDLIKDSIQSLLSSGALVLNKDSKKTRRCGCGPPEPPTPPPCCPPTCCEVCTEPDECLVTEKCTVPSTTIALCQRNLADAKTAEVEEVTPECGCGTTLPCKPTACCNVVAPCGLAAIKPDPIKSDKTESVQSPMYLECVVNNITEGSPAYSCKWKLKKEN